MPTSRSWTVSDTIPLPLQQRSYSAPESRRSSHDGTSSATVALPAITNCSARTCTASGTSASSDEISPVSRLVLEYRQGPRKEMSVGPDGCLRRATQSAMTTQMHFVRLGRSSGFARPAVEHSASPAPFQLTSTHIASKRSPHAMGSAQRSRCLSRAEVGATAFGMPRWEPPIAPPRSCATSSGQEKGFLIAKAQILSRQGNRRAGRLLDSIHRGHPPVHEPLHIDDKPLPEWALSSRRKRTSLLPTRRS